MFDKNLSYFVHYVEIFNSNECDDILNELEKNNEDFEKSKVGTDQISTEIRKSKTFPIYENNKLSDLLLEKFKVAFLNYCDDYLEDPYFMSIKMATPNGYCFESFQLLQYDVDDYYHWHVDQGDDPKTSNRILSFILYLNDDFDGGYTEFSFNKYKPKKGNLLIFPSNFLFPHTGTRVLKGQKNIITNWLNNFNYQKSNEL